MAKQYEGYWKSVNDTDWSVELHNEDVTGATRELKVKDPQIIHDGDVDRLYENPIRNSRASITFVMRDENDYGNFELIALDHEQEWNMRIYREGTLYWVGRVLADQFTFQREARETGWATVTVQAVDGLQLLKDYKMDASMFTIDDRQDVITLIVLILRKLGLESAWSSSTYIYDQTQITNTTASGERIMFDTVRSLAFVNNLDIFKANEELEWVDCYTALEILLKGVLMGARFKHDKGGYWILHPANYDDSDWTYDSYDETGTPLTSNTSYTHRKLIDTDTDRPKFETFPEITYQPTVRSFTAEFDRRNGVLETKTTSNTTSIQATHTNIKNGGTAAGRVVRVNFKVTFDNYSPNAINKYELLYRVYANNPSTSQKYEWYNGAWAAIGSTPANNKIKIDLAEWKAGGQTITQNMELSEPPSGASEIYAECSMQKRTGTITGATRGGVVIVSWLTPTTTAHAFTGYIVISQAYNDAAEYKFEQRANYISNVDTPRDTNSENPIEGLAFYKGKITDVGSVQVFNGTNYVDAGDFGAPWTTLAGDLPELYANTWAGMYSDFVPEIRANIHDDGTYAVIDSYYFDSKIWIFNGGNHDLYRDFISGVWVAVETNYTNVTDDGEGERILKQVEVDQDKFQELNIEASRVRSVLGSMGELMMIDIINNGESAPTSDPATDKEYVVGLKYNYNSGEPYFTWKVREYTSPSGFAPEVTVVTSNTTISQTSGFVIYDASSGSGNITLAAPTAVANTAVYVIKNSGASNSVIFDCAGSETIDGAGTFTIPAGDSITVYSDGSNYKIV